MVQPFPYRNQPIKGFYLTYQVLTTLFARVPYWIIVNLPKRWRPRPSWSLKRCVMVSMWRHFVYIADRSGSIVDEPNHLRISDGPGVKGVWVEATPRLINGDIEIWASVAKVKPCRIPGYWLDRPGADVPVGRRPEPGEKVLYCLHGGGYTLFSAHPESTIAVIARNILQHCEVFQRAFSIEYRLSSTTPYAIANPFPAALIDALAGYNYLIDTVGFAPSDVVIEGDSAGGNLALALTRYLVEYSGRTGLPAPSSIIILCPWADMGSSHGGPNSSETTFTMDFLGNLNAGRNLWSKQAFVGPHEMIAATTNRYISPASLDLSANFAGFPRTFLVAGGAERLYDGIVTLKDRMVADMGEGDGSGQLTYYEAPDAIHDYFMFPWHDPERTDTLKAISGWLSVP